jgi:outer membrane protein assembly factor BamD
MKTLFPAESLKKALVVAAALALLSSCIHKKYETPITKDTQQPDKVLFDKSMHDIEHGRYEVARIELNTLMNTYESSEYLAKAKLAIADSWFREGGANGMAQAEAEYKDFELFYPTMPEASEAQHKICMIHYKQMDKPDRDPLEAIRAETECRALLTQYPNSKYAPATAQILRNVQEVLGEHEFTVGDFYFHRGANPAAANRLSYVADQYPLFSQADDALFEAGQSYLNMGPRFRQNAAADFARIVREYPLSDRADAAKKALQDLEIPLPEVDRAAAEREKYDIENYRKPSMLSESMGFMRRGPDVSAAAKAGQPAMENVLFPIPASVPKANNGETTANGAVGGTTDVNGSIVSDPTKLDQSKDARSLPAVTGKAAAANAQAVPSNHQADLEKARQQAKKKAKKQRKKKAAPQEQQQTAPAAQNSQPEAAGSLQAHPQAQ